MRALLAVLSVLMAAPPLGAQCRLCAPVAPKSSATAVRPLAIEIESMLDLGRAASTGGSGTIAIDERSGTRRVEGMTDLGGFAIKGRVRLTGEPLARVRVSLPSSVRLVAADGSAAEAVDLKVDLPPDPMLDASGSLSFAFGGRLVVPGGSTGDFRGRIPVTADYQ